MILNKHHKCSYISRSKFLNEIMNNDIYKIVIKNMFDSTRLKTNIHSVILPTKYKFIIYKEHELNYHRNTAGKGKGIKHNCRAIDCMTELALRMAYILANINKFPIINDSLLDCGHQHWYNKLVDEIKSKKDDLYFELMFDNNFSPADKYKIIIWTCMISYLFNLGLEDILVKFENFHDYRTYNISYICNNQVIIEPMFKNHNDYYAFKDWNFFHNLPFNKYTCILAIDTMDDDNLLTDIIFNISIFNDFLDFYQLKPNKINDFIKLRNHSIMNNNYECFYDFIKNYNGSLYFMDFINKYLGQ